MRSPLAIILIIAFNLAPIAGVLFFGWKAFEAFWFFWLETLIIALFNSIRIFYSQAAAGVEANPDAPMVHHPGKALKYLLIRIFIFAFYSIFIITFIGFVANEKGDLLSVVRTLAFRNLFFNIGLLVSFVTQSYFLIAYFFRNGNYLRSDPNAYAAIFDGRQIIIHVAVVLGTFASMYLSEHTTFGKYGGAAMIAILCACKCIAELFSYYAGQRNAIRPDPLGE